MNCAAYVGIPSGFTNQGAIVYARCHKCEHENAVLIKMHSCQVRRRVKCFICNKGFSFVAILMAEIHDDDRDIIFYVTPTRLKNDGTVEVTLYDMVNETSISYCRIKHTSAGKIHIAYPTIGSVPRCPIMAKLFVLSVVQ